MKHTVVWVGTAERQWTELWISAVNRAELTRAAQFVDNALAANPLAIGESREGD